MGKIKEILRLKLSCGLSIRAISASSGVARSSISKYLIRANTIGLTWQKVENMSDEELEKFLILPQVGKSKESNAVPDWTEIHKELKKKGVTLRLLWEEYQSESIDGYQYSQFCNLYRKWRDVLDLPMRQTHKAGEKMFVDYCGQTMPVTDKETGEIHQVQIFVAVLGASN